jgi:hypothetical protein
VLCRSRMSLYAAFRLRRSFSVFVIRFFTFIALKRLSDVLSSAHEPQKSNGKLPSGNFTN